MTYKIKFKNYQGFSALYPRVLLLLFMLAGGFCAQAQQAFYFVHPDNTYKILQLATNSQSNGTLIVLGDRNDGSTTLKTQQEWYYDKQAYTIRLKANPNKCLARKNQQFPNDPIVLADYSPNNEAQQWVLEDGKIKLLADKGLCIGLTNYNYNSGNTAVLQEIFNTGNYQKWLFREKSNSAFTADGNLHRVNSPGETFIEFAIPDPCPYKFLMFKARGGDGGSRSVHNIVTGNDDTKAKGGEGAMIQGMFKIGTGTGELKPGTNIRFVIGQAGPTRVSGASEGASSGGGTGVIYEAPGERGGYYYPWEMLLVAGGGGGAYADCCAIHSDGEPGSTNDPYPNGFTYCNFCGGGFRNDSDPVDVTTLPIKNHVYQFSEGRAGFQLIDGIVSPTGGKAGSFGFGGGGDYVWLSAGSGGGYTGGHAPQDYHGGIGGTSFVNSAWAMSEVRKQNSTTSTPANGYVEYQFTNDGPATRDLYFECHKGTEVQVLKSGAWTLLWQYDGNLVLYGPGFPNGAWASNTGGGDLFFQGDGNLVIYQANAGPWSSDTPDDHHDGKGGRKLVLTPDGGLFITDQDRKVIWKGH